MMLRTGRLLLLVTAGGLIAAGLTIVAVGMTVVFVPQDLHFTALQPEMLSEISPRLIPLIAHDRAGFGGGLASTGILIAFCAWYAPSSRSFRQAILTSGLAGFGCAIGIHYLEGYTDLSVANSCSYRHWCLVKPTAMWLPTISFKTRAA
jgi:hypothetical protein